MPRVVSRMTPSNEVEKDRIPTSAVVGNIHHDIGTSLMTRLFDDLVEHVAKFSL